MTHSLFCHWRELCPFFRKQETQLSNECRCARSNLKFHCYQVMSAFLSAFWDSNIIWYSGKKIKTLKTKEIQEVTEASVNTVHFPDYSNRLSSTEVFFKRTSNISKWWNAHSRRFVGFSNVIRNNYHSKMFAFQMGFDAQECFFFQYWNIVV